MIVQVGSGKSSILAALLGELQPILGGAAPDSFASAAPLVHGRVAYCSQVAWVVAGTIRVRCGCNSSPHACHAAVLLRTVL